MSTGFILLLGGVFATFATIQIITLRKIYKDANNPKFHTNGK